MKIRDVRFDELYLRHLCRHSEFGLNVLHLGAVAGVYYSLAGIANALTSLLVEPPWCLLAVFVAIIPYTVILLRFVPPPTAILSLLIVAALVCLEFVSPPVPVWVHILLVVLWHRVQLWSHRFYTKAFDMTGFSQKYPKGFVLFLVLAVFELPLLVHYFLSLGALHAELGKLIVERTDPAPEQ